MRATKRKVLMINSSRQDDLFNKANDSFPTRKKITKKNDRVFKTKEASEIYFGNQSLKAYLKEVNAKEAFIVKELLDEQDWSVFEENYKGGGRAAYAPVAMMGLLLYGIMKGVTSLRGLEQLSRIDLGCILVTGGILPDHSIIGRFIQRHSDVLSEQFFISLTKAVLIKTQSNIDSVSGDGTIIEAAASRYRLITQEAAEKKLNKAKEEAAKALDDEKLKKVKKAEDVYSQIKERQAKRKANGKKNEVVKLSPVEPEAVVQPLKKSKVPVPSYKPSVLANENRVIVAIDLDPSNENRSLPHLLDNAQKLEVGQIKELLLDAGYHAINIIKETTEREIKLLCPSGKTGKMSNQTKPIPKKFSKLEFVYNKEADHYTCPQGNQLLAHHKTKGKGREPSHFIYATTSCQGCLLRELCTSNKKGRLIKRYVGDELKEKLRQEMKRPEAKERYKKRSGMVEPVFSQLRLKQGLQRFRRRGLSAVKVEFALHAMAYNISRVLAYIFMYFLWISYVKRAQR